MKKKKPLTKGMALSLDIPFERDKERRITKTRRVRSRLVILGREYQEGRINEVTLRKRLRQAITQFLS